MDGSAIKRAMSTLNNLSQNRVALIAGPTASGKSDLAVRLAQALDKPSVVINADSAQVYADLRVLSARPSEQEMADVPHSLFGTWDGAVACSAADWAAAAKREIEHTHQAGSVPILVGGTGLYIRTLLDGIAPIPQIDPAVRETVRALPADEAFAALQDADPERADRLHPGDGQRIARALEVVRSTGRTLGDWQKQSEGGIAENITLTPLILLPERETIYARCDTRFAAMLENGAAEEVEALLERDLSPDLPVMRAIGVPEIAGWLRGAWSKEEAIAKGAQATRNYAKRQFTWLRNQPPQDWPRHSPENVGTEALIETLFQ